MVSYAGQGEVGVELHHVGLRSDKPINEEIVTEKCFIPGGDVDLLNISRKN